MCKTILSNSKQIRKQFVVERMMINYWPTSCEKNDKLLISKYLKMSKFCAKLFYFNAIRKQYGI